MGFQELFALAGTISIDSSGAVEGMEEAVDAAEESESKIGNAFKGIAAAAAAYLSATAIWEFGKEMVQAAADVQAESAQFEAAFSKVKNGTDLADEAFTRLEESTGTLSSRLKVTGTKVFSQFTGAGIEGAEAIGMMEEYMRVATDGAAYYDLSLEEVDERLRSFLRGNTEAGDAIGLFTSELQRNERAQEMYGAKFIDLTEAQKQMVMLDISKSIYDASGATGQAARESESYTNVVANLKEQWRQLLAQMGSPIMEAVIPILQSLGGLIESIAPALTTITTYVAKVFTYLSENVWLLEAVAAGITAMATAYGVWTVATKAQELAQRLLNKVMAMSPITWIILGIGLLVAAFVTLWNKCEGFRNFWTSVWNAIKNVASQAWAGIKQVWEQVKPYFTALWNSIKNAGKAAWDLIKKVWNACKPFFKPIFDFIKNIAKSAMDRVKFVFSIAWEGVKLVWNNAKAFFKMIFNTITGIFNVIASVLRGDFKGAWEGIKGIFAGVGQFFKDIVNNIINAFSNIGGKIAEKFKGLGGKIASAAGKVWSGAKKLLGFAGGGVFTGESAIRVAEYPNATTNPEIVTPQRIMRDTFADTLENYNLRATDGVGSSRVEALLEQLIALFGKQKVVLSTGETVGALTPYMDKALGERSAKKERGRV